MKEDNLKEPRDGYVNFMEAKQYESDDNKTYLLKASKSLFRDFDLACRYNNTTSAAALRKLMEAYIYEVEYEKEHYPEKAKLKEMLTLSPSKQMKKWETLPPEQQLEFMEMKKIYLSNQEKDNLIRQQMRRV